MEILSLIAFLLGSPIYFHHRVEPTPKPSSGTMQSDLPSQKQPLPQPIA
jgi:hypothetical protein